MALMRLNGAAVAIFEMKCETSVLMSWSRKLPAMMARMVAPVRLPVAKKIRKRMMVTASMIMR